MHTIKISVREFVEFLYKQGDLQFSSLSFERAKLGSEIHRTLQYNDILDYQKEVYVKDDYLYNDFEFIIDGRIDGLYKEKNIWVIEEIKSTYIPYEQISDNCFVHFAQAYVYAYLFLKINKLKRCLIRLLYFQIDLKKVKTFDQIKTREEINTFQESSILKYVKWAKLTTANHDLSITELKRLVFPFKNYRMYQKAFSSSFYQCITQKEHLFIQAPTGIGKTMAAIFPALKAIGQEKITKMFYITAKTVTLGVAIDALNVLYKNNYHFKSIIITAKDKACMLPIRDCDPNNCPYAKGYFNRINDALYDIISHHDFINYDILETISKKYTVCPFELSLDASQFCDIILGDYNYVFNPRVQLKRYFEELNNYTILIDEAHNLIDRGRDMFSATLSLSMLMICKSTLNPQLKGINNALANLILYLNNIQISQKYPQLVYPQLDDDLIDLVQLVCDKFYSYIQGNNKPLPNEILNVYFEINFFNKICELFNDSYRYICESTPHDFQVTLFCLDPSSSLNQTLSKVHNALFFSATLTPLSFFKSLLLNTTPAKSLNLQSPFDQNNTYIGIHPTIKTTYQHRSQSSSDLIEWINASINIKDGNYIVFAPSYTYLNMLYELYLKIYPDTELYKQEQDMDNDARMKFLSLFDNIKGVRLFFCVMGGMYSEGIDLKGDKLSGLLIISVALPQLNPTNEMLKQYFSDHNKNGFAYAYQYPAMNKVLQACGRLIRSSKDFGFIILFDDRFLKEPYISLLPKHYQHYGLLSTKENLIHDLKKFWQKKEG